MLNTEQFLIKTAEYFDLNLTKLGIRRSAEKTRLYKRQLIKETIEHIMHNIYKEIDLLTINSHMKDIIDEFMNHYDYITKEIYGAYDEKREKEIDWLLLKHFVVPFFAIQMSQNTSFYNDKIDKGLPGGDFWYLPIFDSNRSRISFPLNKLMRWLIDLHGGSNQNFYFLEKYKFNEDNEFNISDSTLKDWHDNFVIPKLETIKEFASFNFQYDGIFVKNNEDPFKSAIDFIESKSLTIAKLKLEIPNKDNILDRLYSDTLTNEEKERFVLYIEERWNKPTSKQIEWLFTISRVSQKCYKDLCSHFNVKIQDVSIDNNKILQLASHFAFIYNTEIELKMNGNSEILELFGLYIHNIKRIKENKKEGLDLILGSISQEMVLYKDNFNIDEVVLISSKNEKSKNKAIINLEMKKRNKEKNKIQEQLIYQAIEDIEKITQEEQIFKYINIIEDNFVLHNIGDYFQGNNYLTNKQIEPNLFYALTIHVQYSRVANTSLDKLNAYSKVVNLLTFPYYPRMLEKTDVDIWLNELNKITEASDNRGQLIILSYKVYHLINQKNNVEIISLIEKFIELTKNMKTNEYNPQVLFVTQDYLQNIKNQKVYKKLKKINEKHPLYSNHSRKEFSFYE